LSHILNTALRATALAAMAMVSAAAFAAVDVDANIELDSTYLNQGRGMKQGGRVEVNASKKVGSDYFIAGRASLLAQKTGGSATDDMWVQFGNETADIKLGRFEAANLYQTPGDTIVNHAGISPYNAGTLRGRMGSDVFHAATNLRLGGGLGLEVGLVASKNAGQATGVRPVLTYANGPLNLAAGFESIKYNATPAVAFAAATPTSFQVNAVAATDSVSSSGFGLTGGYNFGGFTLTANVASGKTAANMKQRGYGLIAQAGPATVGYLWGTQAAGAGVADAKVSTVYASYAIPFFDIKGATITPAVSMSKGGGSNTAANDNGVRVRVNYAF